jgi:hypothetical protein
LAAIAGRQYGVLTVAQLLAAGLSHSAIAKRVARGSLHRIGPGVYALGHDHLSREGEWLAGVFAGGSDAALGRLSAAKLLQVSRFRETAVDVLVTRQRQPRAGLRFHRTRALHPSDVTTHRRIPVTSVHRMLVDLTEVLTPHQEANVIHEAAFRGRYVEAAVKDAMARANGRHRLGVLERAMELHRAGSAGTRSGAEDAFLALVEPEPSVNLGLPGFEVDFHWPELMLAVEIDGGGHARKATKDADDRRDRTLGAADYTVLRFSDDDVYRRPRQVLAACRPFGVDAARN